jgi:cytohesin
MADDPSMKRSLAKERFMLGCFTLPECFMLPPLHAAAFKGCARKFEALLRIEMAIDERDWRGCSALHFAAWGGSKAIVQMLLDEGANVNAKSSRLYFGIKFSYQEELTPLDFAVQFAGHKGSTEIVQMMLDKGADVNLKCTIANEASKPHQKALHPARTNSIVPGTHPVHRPARTSQATGADTSLHYAVQWGNPAIVQLLLDNGAGLDVKSKGGFTPLHRACGKKASGDLLAVVQLLLNKGAAIHARHTP